MKKSIHSVLTESASKVLRPLIRVMIRNGMSSGAFEELVRKAFVDEAFAMARRQGQKSSISSVAAQTGLSRKEVKRLNELEVDHHEDIEQKYNRAVRVITGWTNDRRYSHDDGIAKKLPIDGEGSFAQLVKDYSGDITPKVMLQLLCDAGCATAGNDGVELIKHAFVPGKDSEDIVRILGADTNELINTIDFNMSSEPASRRFQRKVSTEMLDKSAVDEFKDISRQESQMLLERLNTWLSQHEVEDDADAAYVSVGVYFYEQSDEE